MRGLNQLLPGVRFVGLVNSYLMNETSHSQKAMGYLSGIPFWLFIRKCEAGTERDG